MAYQARPPEQYRVIFHQDALAQVRQYIFIMAQELVTGYELRDWRL